MENESAVDVGGAVMRMQARLGEALWMISVLEDRISQLEGRQPVQQPTPEAQSAPNGMGHVAPSGLLASSD
jgi:hypothetical protein